MSLIVGDWFASCCLFELRAAKSKLCCCGVKMKLAGKPPFVAEAIAKECRRARRRRQTEVDSKQEGYGRRQTRKPIAARGASGSRWRRFQMGRIER